MGLEGVKKDLDKMDLVIASIFCQHLGPLSYQGSTEYIQVVGQNEIQVKMV